MRKILLLPLILLASCATKVENSPVEYYYILNIDEYTVGKEKLIPDYYSEGQIVYSKSSKRTTMTLKLKQTALNMIVQEFSKKQQGLVIEDIHLVQRFDTKLTKDSVSLEEFLTYIVVRGEKVEIVQNYFNRMLKDRANRENVGLLNLIAGPNKVTKLFFFPEIDSKTKFEINRSGEDGTISSEDIQFKVKILPEYKHIN